MQVRYTGWALGCVALVLPMCVACGQPPDGTAEVWTAPRTPWGEPDLQGI